MVDQARRDRATNLGYNTFSALQFKGIMDSKDLNPSFSRNRIESVNPKCDSQSQ